MKIIDVQTFGVNLGDGNHVFVKILTDEHLHGIGEAYRVGPDHAVEEAVHYFKDWILGLDPTRIEYIWRLLYNGSRFPGGSILNAAISGIEIACWDLKGKALGVPVYELIGGRCRDRVRVYLGVSGSTPREVADSAKRAQDLGFTAVKMAPHPPNAEKLPWDQVLRGTAARLAAVRKAVGDDMDVGLDPHARIFEPVRALQMAQAVEPYHPMFFEEPLRPENIEAMGRLHRKIPVPIATGEMLYTKYEFRDVIAAEAADILQPDLLLCGGLMESKKIAAMAEAEYLTIAPHSPLGPVSTAVSTHFAASTPNFIILEYRDDSQGPMRNLILEPMKRDGGYLELPQDPGLGIELNEKAFAGNPLKKWHRPFVIEPDGNIAYQ
ncbi:MAG: galactonate dehydratase [Candidatus Aminicenantes bacterium]|nr:galactonate dehydratase [Candidatus Aminicenantes bacterium]